MPEPPGYRLGRRRVYILPTRSGAGFAMTLVVMLVGAVNYNNSLGFALTFTLGAMALVSTLHTNRNLMGLTVRAGAADPVFAGERAMIALFIDNRGGAPRDDLTVRYRVPGEAQDRTIDVYVPAGEVAHVRLPAPSTRRGWLALERLQIATRYPFGLFRAWSRPQVELRALVYPQPEGSQALPVLADESSGEGLSAGPGREDFSGLREYQPGDSPRQIHWKAAARTSEEQAGGLPVKLFSGAGAGEALLDFDRTQGPLEARLSQLCRWAIEAETRGLHYSLNLPSEALARGHGDAHRARALRALALYGEEAPPA